MTDTTPADEREALRAFADEILSDWPEGFPDGFGIQDLAIKHGLLIGTEKTTPCELAVCNCAEYNGDGEKVTCYRRSDLLQARAASQPAQEQLTSNDIARLTSLGWNVTYCPQCQEQAGSSAPPADTARQDRIDAERYRWLRQPGQQQDFICGVAWGSPDEMDAAIDAALEAEVRK
jgi:hypothetical protein